jgi:hypothetical protein
MVFNLQSSTYIVSGEKIGMNNDTVSQFRNELNSFFVLVLLNMVFGALTMAFGMQIMIMSVLGLPGGLATAVVLLLTGGLALVCFVLGFTWVVSSAKILKGVTAVRREFKNHSEPVSPEILTGWIVRIMGHYRENRERIRWMTRICALGGCAFITLGILNLVQGLSSGPATGGGMWIQVMAFLAAGINLTIGGASLLFSTWFQRYTRAWDRRTEEASRSEDALKKAMEQR